MSPLDRRCVVWLVLAGYLFAVTGATSFHDHARTSAAHPTARHGACGHCHGDFEPARSLAGGDLPSHVVVGRSDAAPAGESHAACAVCQFLSQKVLPARPVATADSEPLRETAIFHLPSPVAAARVHCHQSRAPPSLA